jgi:hypothetical protein
MGKAEAETNSEVVFREPKLAPLKAGQEKYILFLIENTGRDSFRSDEDWSKYLCHQVEDYLDEAKVHTRPIYYMRYNRDSETDMHAFKNTNWRHTWVELSDGTIIDPTIGKFFDFKKDDQMLPFQPDDYPNQHQLWIVGRNDPRRENYLYLDREEKIIGNAKNIKEPPGLTTNEEIPEKLRFNPEDPHVKGLPRPLCCSSKWQNHACSIQPRYFRSRTSLGNRCF